MKILTAEQTRQADRFTIDNEPVLAIDLMERAAQGCTNWIGEHHSVDTSFGVVCGTGNNGGDGLAITRQLLDLGYNVSCWFIEFSPKASQDTLLNLKRLSDRGYSVTSIDGTNSPDFSTCDVVIDALFGSGLNRPISGMAKNVVESVNRFEAAVISIDLPSGLFSENNSQNDRSAIVHADHVLALHTPKLALLLPENGPYVGDWTAIPIGLHEDIISRLPSPYHLIDHIAVRPMLKTRRKYGHKGTYGHAKLACGSKGKMGAAVLSGHACLRAGAGLLTMHIPTCGYEILQTALPEAMVECNTGIDFLTDLESAKAEVLGIGPGIGTRKETADWLKQTLKHTREPMVLDADALNIISSYPELLGSIPAKSILTPHPKELERLVGEWTDDLDKMNKLSQLSSKTESFVVLKGAHTCIATPDGQFLFNSTGNAGMATAGSGDVLTGILTGLLAQQYDSAEAAVLGVYIHGLAGDLARKELSMEAMIASDIVKQLGNAFKFLRNNE